MKTFRSFMSYMALEPLFEAEEVLKAAIEVLELVQYRYTHQTFFSEIVKASEMYKLDLEVEPNNEESSAALRLIQSSIEIFKKKLLDLREKGWKESLPTVKIASLLASPLIY